MQPYDPAHDLPILVYNPPEGGFTVEEYIERIRQYNPQEAPEVLEFYRHVPTVLNTLVAVANAALLGQVHTVVHVAPPRAKAAKTATKKTSKKSAKSRPHRSRQDTLALVEQTLAQHPDWRRQQLAAACGLSESYVGALLREMRGKAVREAIVAGDY